MRCAISASTTAYLDVARGDAAAEGRPRRRRGDRARWPDGRLRAADKHPFLQTETALIEKAIAAGRPVLGICLGAQLIAQVLGARVYPGEHREVGWAPVELTDDGQDDPLFVGGSATSSPSSTCTATPTSCRPTR